nr:MAG TPA: tail tape measure [Caudoviricetes sp.]
MSKQVIEERLIKLGIDNEQFKQGLKESLSSLSDLDKGLKQAADGKSGLFGNSEKSAKSLSQAITGLLNSAPKLGNAYLGVFDKITSAIGGTTGSVGKLVSSMFNFVSPISSGTKGVADGLNSIEASVASTSGKFGMLQSVATVALGNIAASAITTGLSIAKNIAGNILHSIAPLKAGFGQFEDKINSVNMLVAALGKSELGNITGSLDDLQKYAETTKYSVKQMHSSLAQFVNAGVGLNDATTALKGWGNLAASAGATTDGFNRSLQFGVQQALQMGMMNTQNWMSVENAGMATKRFKDILVQTAQALGQNVDMSEGFRGSLKDGWLTNEVLIKSLEQLANDETLVKMASEFHTFGEVAEAVSDQVTSAWARFWETLVGQAGSDEVTAFWTKWGNIAANALGAAGDKATELAKAFVSFGGRDNIIKALESAFSSVGGIFKSFGDAFTHVFGGDIGSKMMQGLSNGISKFADKIRLGKAELDAFHHIFILVFQSLKWITAEVFAKLKFLGALIPNHLVKDLIIIAGMISKVFYTSVRMIEKILQLIIPFDKIGGIFKFIGDVWTGLWDKLHNGLASFSEKWYNFFGKIPPGFDKIVAWFSKLWQVIKFLTPSIDRLKQSLHGLISKITNPFTTLGDALGSNTRKFNEWLFFVGSATQRFPIFGKALGKFLVGFSNFNDATRNMDHWAGRLGNNLRNALWKISHTWANETGRIKVSYREFWGSLNEAMDGVLKREILTWKQFMSVVKWDKLIPPQLKNVFSGFSFKMPDMSGLKAGLASFAGNPFGAMIGGTQNLSKWLETTTFSFKGFADIIRRKWPTLDEYADKLEKVKFSLSFLKPVVDKLGEALKWLKDKFSDLSFGKLDLSGITKPLGDAGKAIHENFSEGVVPGIVKSVDGFRKWAGELSGFRIAFAPFAAGGMVIKEAFGNIRNELKNSKVDFSSYKGTLNTFKGWFNGFWQGLKRTASGPTLTTIGDGIKHGFTSTMDWLRTNVGPWFGDFFNSLPTGLRNAFERLGSALHQFISIFGSAFTGAKLDFSSFGSTIQTVGDAIHKVFEKLKEALKSLWNGFKEIFKVHSASADEMTAEDYGVSKLDTLSNKLGDVDNKLGNLNTKTSSIFGTIGDLLKMISGVMGEAFKPLEKADSAQLGKIFVLVGGIMLLWNTRKKVLGIKEVFATFFDTLTKGSKAAFDAAKGMFTQLGGFFKAKARFENIKAFALAIGTLTAALLVLSFIPQDKLITGIMGLTAVLVAFEAFYLTLSITTSKFDKDKVDGAKKMMLGMISIAGSIFLVSGAVAILGRMDPGALLRGGFAATVLLTVLGGITVAMTHFQGVGGTKTSEMRKISVSLLTFIGIAYAVKKVAKEVVKLGSMDIGTLGKGLGAIAVIIGGLTAIIWQTSKMENVKMSSVLTFLTVAKAVSGITKTIQKLGEMDTGTLIQGGTAVSILLTVIGGIAYAFSRLDNTKQSFTKNATVLFAGIGGLMFMMTKLANDMGQMKDPNSLAIAIGAMAVAIAAMGAISQMIKSNGLGDRGIDEGIKNVAVIAGSLAVAAIGLSFLANGDANWGEIVVASAALVAVFYGISKVGQVAGRLKAEDFKGMTAVVASIIGAAAGLKILSSVPIKDLMWQSIALVGIFGAIAGIGTLMSKFGGAGAVASITGIAAAFLAMAAGIAAVVAASGYFIDSLGRVINAVTNLLETVSTLGKEGGRRFAEFFKEASKGGDDMAKVVGKMAEGIVTGAVEGVSNNMPRIIQIGIDLIKGIAIGVARAANDLVGAIVEIGGQIIDKVLSAIPTWILKICDAVLSGMRQIAQWVRNNRNVIVVSVMEVFAAITSVIAESIAALLGMIFDAIGLIPGLGGIMEDAKKAVYDAADSFTQWQQDRINETKRFAELMVKGGVDAAVQTLEKLGQAEVQAAIAFSSKSQDGLEKFKIFCSQLGIQGADEFIKGLKSGTVSAQEAAKLFAKMVEMGMSEADVKKIAEAAGYDYANGVLKAKPQAKTSGEEVKKSLEEGLGGDGSFDLTKLTSAFTKLNEFMGGNLDMTKVTAGIKSGEINQEMIQKLSEGDFSNLSEEQMKEFIDGLSRSEGPAGDRAKQIREAVIAGLSNDGQGFDQETVAKALVNLDTHLGGKLDEVKALAAIKSGEIPPEIITALATGDFSKVSEEQWQAYIKKIEDAAPPAGDATGKVGEQVNSKLDEIKASALTKADETGKGVVKGLDVSGSVPPTMATMDQYVGAIDKGGKDAAGSAKNTSKSVTTNLGFNGGPIGQEGMAGYNGGIIGGKGTAQANASAVRNAATGQLSFDATGSGAAITRSFASGLNSPDVMALVSGAASRVMSAVSRLFPHSPAKEGPFSGDGWRAVARSGKTIVKEFASGLGSSSAMNFVTSSMNGVMSYVHDAIVGMNGYLDENMELSPTIKPVLDMSNLNGYSWTGNGSLNLNTIGVDYGSLNPTTNSLASNRADIASVVAGLNRLDEKLETLNDYTSVSNDLLAQDRVSPVYMDKDLVNRALAPGMAEAQRSYSDRINMLEGVLPTI